MLNQMITNILVRKIRNGENNPNTGKPMELEDIKIQEYKDAVASLIGDL